MGDMLVKAGDVRAARAIYANAKASHEYASWKFRDVLDARIADAETNVAAFNHPGTTSTRLMIDSAFACMGCHEQ